MKKRLARLVELSREQSQTAQENLKLAQDSARLAGKQVFPKIGVPPNHEF